MSEIKSVYIVEAINYSWIIERLMRDIASELAARGIAVRIGPGDGYQGEQVIFNSRFLVAFSNPKAEVNSLFITHVDDKIKEMELQAAFKSCNSFVCMSSQDAEFVAALKGGSTGVAGIALPTRDLTVRPIRIALFSAFYEDGRKNERWISDYFRDKPAACKQNFIFCFMGWGWEKFCASLGDMEMNYEIYRYSRFTPGEYGLYKEVLATMDSLVYLGFDGGAMSMYDAINAGVEVIVPNASYHQGLDGVVTTFDDQAGFSRELDRLHRKNALRKEALARRSITSYTDALLAHWRSLMSPSAATGISMPKPVPNTVEAHALETVRRRYKSLSVTRVRSALIRMWQSFFM